MPHLEVYRPRESWWDRAKRSLWLGPYNTKDKRLADLFGGQPASTGIPVTEESALNYSAVWAAVSLIASQVGSLPLILYKRRADGGKERMTKHPLYWLLHDEPNPEMTSMVFRETLTAHVLTWGGGYAEIERDQVRRPVALWPITPDRVMPKRDERTKQLYYEVTNPNGRPVDIDPMNMLHVPGLGFNGTCGYSVISKARETIGLGLAAERFGGTFFGNGSTFGGVFEHPGTMSDPAKKHFKDWVGARNQGVENAHKFIVVEEGMKYQRLGIPPEDAQFLETRQFQITEIARWFQIPPHKLRDLQRATFSNIEQQSIEFVTDTLRPWLIRWEQEINRKLVMPLERGIQFAEHLVDGLLRGDIQSRYAAYAVGRQWGWLSADDVLEKENGNPLPDGQGTIYLVPQNMAPADRINDIIDKQVAPTPAPVAPGPSDPAPKDDTPARAIEALREELAAAQASAAEHIARAEEHLVRAAAAETTAARLPELQAEADARGAAVEDAQREVARLSALLIEATERETRLQADRERAEGDGMAAIAAADVERRRADEASAAQAREAEARAVAESRQQQTEQEATAARTARDAADTAVTAQREAEIDRLTGMIAAHRALIVDAVGRMVRRETSKAHSNHATAEKLRKWVDSFYVADEDLWVDALLPAMRVHLTWSQSADDPKAITRGFVREHFTESRRQLRAVANGDPEELHVTLERMLQRWEEDRPAALADRILAEEVAYVRTLSR